MHTTMTRQARDGLRLLLLLQALNALSYATIGPPDVVQQARKLGSQITGRLMGDVIDDLPSPDGDEAVELLQALYEQAKYLPSDIALQIATVCGSAEAEPLNYDHWLGRLAWHLELLLRHHDGAAELDTAAHRSVAGEMARACLADYQTMRAAVPAGAVA